MNIRLRRQVLATAFAVSAISFLGILTWPHGVDALSVLPECARQEMPPGGSPPPPPGLSCALQVMTNIANLILGFSGSVALLAFVYAGFLMIISNGESGKMTEAKGIIKTALIGLAIIMCSGLLIQFVLSRVGLSKEVEVIGARCAEGGTRLQLPSGLNKCVSSCADLSSDGYSCTTNTAGLICESNLCPDKPGESCCYKH